MIVFEILTTLAGLVLVYIMIRFLLWVFGVLVMKDDLW